VELLVEWRPGLNAAALGLAGGEGVRLRRFDARELSDPIANGRLLARLQASEGVVAVGFDAAAWAARELEGVRVHFAGGVTRVAGPTLDARGWTGELPYGAGPLLDFAKAEGWKRLGVLHTPGYETVLPELRRAAAARGLRLDVRSAPSRKDIPALAKALAADCDALWVLGDPVLTRGPGFAFLVELSLSRRLPLVAPEPDMVEAGAYVAWEADWAASAAEAAKVARAARTAAGWPRDRLALGGGPGRLRVNEVLRRRWAGAGTGGSR
jgi:hypothetical protein